MRNSPPNFNSWRPWIWVSETSKSCDAVLSSRIDHGCPPMAVSLLPASAAVSLLYCHNTDGSTLKPDCVSVARHPQRCYRIRRRGR